MEDLDSWEIIPSPFPEQPSSPSRQLGEDDLGVFVKENFYEECSAFPPSEHEGLQISNDESFESSSLSSFSACSEFEDGYLQQDPQPDSWTDVTVQMGRKMRLQISNISKTIVSATSSFWPCAACRAKVWTLNSLTTFMAAMAFTLAYARMNRWQKQAVEESNTRLLILLRQQERKISQLLLQIAQMNEMLSVRRRVPVLRSC